MEKYKPITKQERNEYRRGAIFFWFCGLILLGLTISSLVFDGISSFGYAEAFLMLLGIFGTIMGIIFWNLKTTLTPGGEEEEKRKSEEFSGKWYVRYAYAIFALGVAYVCFFIWSSGIELKGIFILFFNPIVGVLAIIGAIFNAWELSIVVIILGVSYLLFLGVAALPVSVAIIIGSVIIAYGIKTFKA